MTTNEVVQIARNAHPTQHKTTIAEVVLRGLDLVERLMLDVTSSDVNVLKEASHHILKAGGKRIRPQLVLLSYLALGGHDIEYAVPVAAAVELVHTASVVHDDINDHGIIRRGRPSVNSIWGRTFALLTGDYLFTKVYELMAPYQDANVLLAEGTVALVEGETLQAAAVKDNNLTRETYMRIIDRKTAALFKSGAQLGAHLVGATDEQMRLMGEFGYNIGLAFQIVDDILDLTGSDEQLGKTSGIDREQGKGFASVNDDAIADSVLETLHEKLSDEETIARGRAEAEALVAAAISALDGIPESPARSELVQLGNLVIARTK